MDIFKSSRDIYNKFYYQFSCEDLKMIEIQI